MKPSLLVIGCGNMGSAMVRGWCRDKWNSKFQFLLYDTVFSKAHQLAEILDLQSIRDLRDVQSEPHLILLAVKPHHFQSAVEEVTVFENSIFMSVAAGISIKQLQSFLGNDKRIVRLMPNLGVEVGEGVIAMSFSPSFPQEDQEDLLFFLSSLGWVFEADENEFDCVTALSGSGPGFTAVFIEAMMDAGVKIGLPWEKSLKLVLQTLMGTVTLLKVKNLHPGLLKNMVCSPGGTTITGIHQLEKAGFRGAVMNGIEAACNRVKNTMHEE